MMPGVTTVPTVPTALFTPVPLTKPPPLSSVSNSGAWTVPLPPAAQPLMLQFPPPLASAYPFPPFQTAQQHAATPTPAPVIPPPPTILASTMSQPRAVGRGARGRGGKSAGPPKKRGRPPKNPLLSSPLPSSPLPSGPPLSSPLLSSAVPPSRAKRRGRPAAVDPTEEAFALGCPLDLAAYKVPWVDENFWQNAEKLYFPAVEKAQVAKLRRFMEDSAALPPEPLPPPTASSVPSPTAEERPAATEAAVAPEVDEVQTPVIKRKGRPCRSEEARKLQSDVRESSFGRVRRAVHQGETEDEDDELGIMFDSQAFRDLAATERAELEQLERVRNANMAALDQLVHRSNTEMCLQSIYQQFGQFLKPLQPEVQAEYEAKVQTVKSTFDTLYPRVAAQLSTPEGQATTEGLVVEPSTDPDLDFVATDADMLPLPFSGTRSVASRRSSTHADEKLWNAYWAIAGPRCQLEFSQLLNAQRTRNTSWRWGTYDPTTPLLGRPSSTARKPAMLRPKVSRPDEAVINGAPVEGDVPQVHKINDVTSVAKAASSHVGSISDTLDMPATSSEAGLGYHYRFAYLDSKVPTVDCVIPTVQPSGTAMVGTRVPSDEAANAPVVAAVPPCSLRLRAQASLAAGAAAEQKLQYGSSDTSDESEDESRSPRRKKAAIAVKNDVIMPSMDGASDSEGEGERDQGRQLDGEAEANPADGADAVKRGASASKPVKRKKRRSRSVVLPRRRKNKARGSEEADDNEAGGKVPQTDDEDEEEDEALAAARRQAEQDQQRKAEADDGYNTEEEERIRLGNAKLRLAPTPFATASSLMPHLRGHLVQWVPDATRVAKTCLGMHDKISVPSPPRCIVEQPAAVTEPKSPDDESSLQAEVPSSVVPMDGDPASAKAAARRRADNRVKSLAKSEARRTALLVAVLKVTDTLFHTTMVAPPPPKRRCMQASLLHPMLGLPITTAEDVDPARESFVRYLQRSPEALRAIRAHFVDLDARDVEEDIRWFATHVPLGTLVDARDLDGSWCVAVVMAESRDGGLLRRFVRVRFAGWDASADDWISVADGRIAPPGFRTCAQ